MMYCVREKPVSVITELKYMQNSREEFETMLRALKDKDFAGKNLAEELELTQISFPPAQAEEISAMLMQRAIPPDAQRAAMFFLLHNLSYNGLGTEFAALDRDWTCNCFPIPQSGMEAIFTNSEKSSSLPE